MRESFFAALHRLRNRAYSQLRFFRSIDGNFPAWRDRIRRVSWRTLRKRGIGVRRAFEEREKMETKSVDDFRKLCNRRCRGFAL